ncbi:MAG: ABC transporter ATP-binding protein [Gemmataceae bacterium]
MLLEASSLSFRYGKQEILQEVDFHLNVGEWVSVVGPNGAGKTTLLRLLLGLLSPLAGTILLDGEPLRTLSRTAIARKIAFLPQFIQMPFGFTVREVVAMGRTPYLGRFRPMCDADLTAVDRALERADVRSLSDRPVTELSGGEAQRVFLARALAQETSILALDEPTTNLDLFHQQQLLNQVKEHGQAVIAVLHELNLAARYSDRILILSNGKVSAFGTPEETLTPDTIEAAFRVKTTVTKDPTTNRLRIHS